MNLLPSKQELDRILLGRAVEEELEKLQELGTLAVLFPEVQAMVGFGGGDSGHKDLWGHTKRVVAQCVPQANVRWAALFHDIGKVKCYTRGPDGTISFHGHEVVSARYFNRIAARTRLFEESERLSVHFLIHHLGHVEEYDSSWTDSAVRRLSRHVGDNFEDLVALARADITTKHQDKRLKHHERMKELRDRALEIAKADAIPPALPTGLGNALTAEFGVPPSRALGDLMKVLKEAVESGQLERQPNIAVVFKYIRDNSLV